MRRTLTNEEFDQQLRDFTHTAFRMEAQPVYWVAGEREPFAQYLAGRLDPDQPVEAYRSWFEQIRSLTSSGRRVERVRVHDDPPNDYQAFLQWQGRWSVEAGERVDYLTRDEARKAGLLPGVLPRDWWLFDNDRLMLMTHNEHGKRVHTELVTDDHELQQARAWWDLAVRTTRGETT